MEERIAGCLLAELARQSGTLSGLNERLITAGRIQPGRALDVEAVLRALQREGKVRSVAPLSGDAVVWEIAAVGSVDEAPLSLRRRLESHSRPAYGPGRHILKKLSELALTPAENPRNGSIGLMIRWRDRAIDARVEVVDGSQDRRCFWLCIRVFNADQWRRLRSTAETPSPGWVLPWIVAPQAPSDLPSLLVWRSVDLDGVVDAIVEAGQSLRFGSLSDATAVAIKPPPQKSRDRPEATDAGLVDRLIRRRGPIPTGRKLPIQGYCDRCGQPLSDPYSLLIGIGPTCRQHYPSHVIAAVARGAVLGVRSGAYTRSPTDALLQLAQAWAHA